MGKDFEVDKALTPWLTWERVQHTMVCMTLPRNSVYWLEVILEQPQTATLCRMRQLAIQQTNRHLHHVRSKQFKSWLTISLLLALAQTCGKATGWLKHVKSKGSLSCRWENTMMISFHKHDTCKIKNIRANSHAPTSYKPPPPSAHSLGAS